MTINGITASGTEFQLSYDFENRLIRQQTPTADLKWRYDGAGKRLEMNRGAAPQRFVLDINTPLTQVIGIADEVGAISDYFVYGLGLVSRIDHSGNAAYYHYDSRGSTIAVTDQNGAVQAGFAYDPFGQLIGRSPADALDRFTFLGRHGVMDETNSFYYVRARHYSARRGRFVQKDSFLGADDQSQSLHRYVYAMNNPIKFVDVSGFSSKDSNSLIANTRGTSDRRNQLLLEIQEGERRSLEIELSNIKLDAAIQIATAFNEAGKSAFAFLTGGPAKLAPALVNQAATFFEIVMPNSKMADHMRVGASGAELLVGGFGVQTISNATSFASNVANTFGASSRISDGLSTISEITGLINSPGHFQGLIETADNWEKVLSIPFDIYSTWHD